MAGGVSNGGGGFGRKHPSRDAIFSGQNLAKKCPKLLSASRDVIVFGQICGSKLQNVFTLGDGCWLPGFPICSRLSRIVLFWDQETRRGPEIHGSYSSMKDQDADLSPCNFATTQLPQTEEVLSPCRFTTAHLTACILKFYLPLNFVNHEMEDPFTMPHGTFMTFPISPIVPIVLVYPFLRQEKGT